MHYYVSIPALDHKVFKYAGYRVDDTGPLDWYAKNGITGSESEIAEGPYHVLAADKYLGDQIDEDLQPYGKPHDFVPKQYVVTVKIGHTVFADMHVARSSPDKAEECRVRAMVNGCMLHTFQIETSGAIAIAIARHIEIESAQKILSITPKRNTMHRIPRTLNIDTYRSTISELSPCTNDRVAAGKRDALWVTCFVARMIQDWGAYADDYAGRHHADILNDCVLGPEWEAVGRGLRALLNGEILVDAGTADACIVRIFQNEGLKL